uniref:aldehyde oxygenase (deformylating) n=1 Tax=Aegilops tauschii subsp. strangulata TaxID=200361 RepID=A0A453CII1_AEGTS
MPMWETKGAIIMALLHAGPVEFLYYWFHRALHHHFLYSRYHSHHHASIVTEPAAGRAGSWLSMIQPNPRRYHPVPPEHEEERMETRTWGHYR